MNRREFLKVAGVTTAVTGAALATKPKNAFAVELGKEHDEFPLEITKDFKGFDQKNVFFMRAAWDKEPYTDEHIIKTYGYEKPVDSVKDFALREAGVKPNLRAGKLGYRQIDIALNLAGWSVEKSFNDGSAGGNRSAKVKKIPINLETGEVMEDMPVLIPGLNSWDNSEVDHLLANGGNQYKFKDKKEASVYIKKAAKFLGADLVGIVPYERAKKWVYTEWATRGAKGITTAKPDFKKEAGFEPKSVIVLAYEMDYHGFKTAPSLVASASAGVKYSKMAETNHKIATFLRHIGYKAAPCGNDTAMSIPLAIEAGLGEAGRMGIIVTEKYGPRVRISKIFTDLELQEDKPITFGVKEFCNVCMKCADACPSKAITHEPAQVIKEGMEFDTGKVNKSICTGVEKWFVNGERCNAFWGYNGGDCGTCISVCPYNKIDEWHHDLSKLMTLTPFKPLLRSMDELFGYGGPVEPEVRIESKYLKDAINDFWEKV